MAKIISYKYLILIVILGALLRFIGLNQMPPSLNWDEVSHGVNAFSILKTGHDQWGQFLPIANFRAYGDYPLPLNLYLTIPFILIFGLTQTAIRLPHALFGTFTIISVFFLAEGLFKNKKVSLIAAFLTAIDPWFLFPSRAVFQSNLSVFFLVTAFALFFNREKNKFFLSLSFLSFAFTLFSYHSTRIITPLLIVGLLIFYKKYKFLLLSLVGIGLVLLPGARARSNVVFIIDQGAISQIENARNTSTSPLKKLLYNKVTYFVEKFTKNYVDYFSPQFLFLKGGTQYQFSVPEEGLLYVVNLPFFYLGLLVLIWKSLKSRDYRFLLFWLVLSPIPAAITQDTNALIRATTMLPIPEILIALGLYETLKKLKRYELALSFIFVCAMILSLERYINVYGNSYRTNYSWSWQYGYEQAVDYVHENYDKYDQVIFTKAYGEPHEFVLFYMQYNPQKYLSDPNKITFYQSNWYWVDRFDKFWFVNDWQVKDLVTESKHKIDCTNKSCLLITTPNNAPVGFKKINEIKFLDGKTAFEIYNNL